MQNQNVIITDKERLEITIAKMRADGLNKLQVVSDFDKTLTSCFVNSRKIASLIAILRDEHYLTPDYSAKAQALYEKYHSFEHNLAIPRANREAKMQEWWSSHYELLVKCGLSKDDLVKIVQSEKIALRPGGLEFFNFLHAHDIPLLILSSAGVGIDAISLFLERFEKLTDNIFIASNAFIWDEQGRMVGVKQPIVHSLKKNYHAVKDYPFYDKLKARKNVILLGDGIEDADMTDGFDYDNIIKIGFLNENERGELADYQNTYDILVLNEIPMGNILKSFKKVFDVIILNDGPMDYINALLKGLVMTKK